MVFFPKAWEEMSDNGQSTAKENSGRKFRRPVDFIIILFFLSGAAFSFNLFRLDILENKKPVGTIIISNNVVQQRMANRKLWDRLGSDSPVYSGDQIRTADLSNATLLIERNSIDLNEKTVIRIQRSPDDQDAILISLEEGNLVITTVAGGGNMALSIAGRLVETAPGTVLSASVGKDGAIVQVSEGTATLVEGGRRREISSGRMIALDSGGVEQTLKSAVMLQPRPDARYLKLGSEPLFVNFIWNRINLDTGEALYLELAEDRNFNRKFQVIENLDTSTGVALNTGTWYWRLSLMSGGVATYGGVAITDGVVLSTGRLSVVSAEGPVLLSPVRDSLFRYQNKLPQLRFQWSEISGAVSYILEADQTPDFINPRLRRQTASVSLIESSLEPGTWYWRVLPVFPAVYEGSSAFSSVSFFRIEQGGADDVAIVLPGPEIEQAGTVPLLPAPLNRLPLTGHRIGIEQLRESDSIVFTWSAVQGANAYIFTLYQATTGSQTAGGRRQIIRVPPENRRSWTLENVAALDRGNFIWQVEAVNMNSAGTIERRGDIGENYFIIDIPQSGNVQMENPGTLYGD
jgi:hypothetical protein